MTSQKVAHDPLQATVVCRQLEAGALDVTTLCSTEGLLLYVSAAVGPMLGWEPAELTGFMVGDFVRP